MIVIWLWRPSCTDPTYKEWKLCVRDFSIALSNQHGSYLQGMETPLRPDTVLSETLARILPTRNGNL